LELTLPRLIVGAYKKFDLGQKGLYTAMELDVDVTTDGRRNTLLQTNAISVDPHFGLAFGFKEYVVIRAGISNIQYVKDFDDSRNLNFQPNIGIGLNLKNVYLDYAFTDIGDASVALYSHVISLRLKLNKPKNAKKQDWYRIQTTTWFSLSFTIVADYSAQTYGNEWIDYNQKYYSFKVASPSTPTNITSDGNIYTGVYRIEYSTLVNANIPLATIHPDNFQLFGREKEVPLHIVDGNDGSFDAGDYFFFTLQRKWWLVRFNSLR